MNHETHVLTGVYLSTQFSWSLCKNSKLSIFFFFLMCPTCQRDMKWVAEQHKEKLNSSLYCCWPPWSIVLQTGSKQSFLSVTEKGHWFWQLLFSTAGTSVLLEVGPARKLLLAYPNYCTDATLESFSSFKVWHSRKVIIRLHFFILLHASVPLHSPLDSSIQFQNL